MYDLQIFSMRLEEVSCRVPLSPDILNILWENVAYLCCNTFVEGGKSTTNTLTQSHRPGDAPQITKRLATLTACEQLLAPSQESTSPARDRHHAQCCPKTMTIVEEAMSRTSPPSFVLNSVIPTLLIPSLLFYELCAPYKRLSMKIDCTFGSGVEVIRRSQGFKDLYKIFSNAKKCSNGGRALMQLDFTQFLSKFEKLTSIKPIPNREFVEAYVKAYYQPDTELETWIKEHSQSRTALPVNHCRIFDKTTLSTKTMSRIPTVVRVAYLGDSLFLGNIAEDLIWLTSRLNMLGVMIGRQQTLVQKCITD
uniref:(California timema) hypothetical protein n=1 Tax=Timema californicum TaxID=61474 RepID=A0A7R9P7C6_TIMCA|nr:unnamed protein product [Timema californicum]